MPVFTGKIQSSKLTLFNRAELDRWIASHKDCTVSLTIEVKKKKRSTEQNAYYWGVVVPLVRDGLNDLGNEFSLEQTHEFLKKEFNYKEIVNHNTGEIKTIPESTTDLSTFEFNEYKEKIQRFAVEFLGIQVPDPNEPLKIYFK